MVFIGDGSSQHQLEIYTPRYDDASRWSAGVTDANRFIIQKSDGIPVQSACACAGLTKRFPFAKTKLRDTIKQIVKAFYSFTAAAASFLRGSVVAMTTPEY